RRRAAGGRVSRGEAGASGLMGVVGGHRQIEKYASAISPISSAPARKPMSSPRVPLIGDAGSGTGARGSTGGVGGGAAAGGETGTMSSAIGAVVATYGPGDWGCPPAWATDWGCPPAWATDWACPPAWATDWACPPAWLACTAGAPGAGGAVPSWRVGASVAF